MSKDLTEQWKKGELEQGYYYTKYTPKVGKPFVEIELRNYLLDLAKVRDADTVEVLAPVPSYEEWQELNDVIKRTKSCGNYPSKVYQYKARITALTEENQQLKELLIECRKYFYGRMHDFFIKYILNKIDEVLNANTR